MVPGGGRHRLPVLAGVLLALRVHRARDQARQRGGPGAGRRTPHRQPARGPRDHRRARDRRGPPAHRPLGRTSRARRARARCCSARGALDRGAAARQREWRRCPAILLRWPFRRLHHRAVADRRPARDRPQLLVPVPRQPRGQPGHRRAPRGHPPARGQRAQAGRYRAHQRQPGEGGRRQHGLGRTVRSPLSRPVRAAGPGDGGGGQGVAGEAAPAGAGGGRQRPAAGRQCRGLQRLPARRGRCRIAGGACRVRRSHRPRSGLRPRACEEGARAGRGGLADGGRGGPRRLCRSRRRGRRRDAAGAGGGVHPDRTRLAADDPRPRLAWCPGRVRTCGAGRPGRCRRAVPVGRGPRQPGRPAASGGADPARAGG